MTLQRIVQGLARHMTDSTAMVASSHPVYSLLETAVAGMTPMESLIARGLNAAATYAGGGGLVAYFRDVSKQKFNVTSESGEKAKIAHDTGYMAVCNLFSTVLFYCVAGAVTGSFDAKKVGIATGMATLAGIGLGAFELYSVDVMRDLVGVEDSMRVPLALRSQSPSAKKRIAGELVLFSVGLCALTYQYSPQTHSLVNQLYKMFL